MIIASSTLAFHIRAWLPCIGIVAYQTLTDVQASVLAVELHVASVEVATRVTRGFPSLVLPHLPARSRQTTSTQWLPHLLRSGKRQSCQMLGQCSWRWLDRPSPALLQHTARSRLSLARSGQNTLVTGPEASCQSYFVLGPVSYTHLTLPTKRIV